MPGPLGLAYGDFGAGLRSAALPDAVRRKAAWIVADSVAAIAAGLRVPEMRTLSRRLLGSNARGAAHLIGMSFGGPAKDVAFLNGTAGTWLELNEGHIASRGHPAIHVLPAIWALAEERGASGSAVLAALVAGYEIGARIGRASQLREAVHPHGTFGTVGAAAAVAQLAGLDAAGIADAINLASTMGMATSRRTLLEGATVRNTYAGSSARAGLLALDLLEAGFTAEADGVPTVYGKVYADSFSTEAALEGLGSEFMLLGGYIKLHPCGRYLHSALDLAEDIIDRHGTGFAVTGIEAIDIDAYHPLSMLCGQAPTTSFGARFSAPFAVASLLVHGGRDFANFDQPAVDDPVRRNLAERITVREEPEFTAAYPGRQRCRMTVRWRGGMRETLTAEHIRGEAENPHAESDLAAKFHATCAPLWGLPASQAMLGRLLAIEDAADLRQLVSDLPHDD
jgi:2-methylcitrate dehydratase PrpD